MMPKMQLITISVMPKSIKTDTLISFITNSYCHSFWLWLYLKCTSDVHGSHKQGIGEEWMNVLLENGGHLMSATRSVEQRDVHMKMWPNTIEKIDKLKDTFHVSTKTDAVRAAIDIALAVTDAIMKGGKLIIEEENGSKSKLIIAGLYPKEK